MGLEDLQAGDPPQIGPYLLLGRLGAVGLAFDAAHLFIGAEDNYQGPHPMIGRAEIPGQFIGDSWQGDRAD